jgi:hypothetical protein
MRDTAAIFRCQRAEIGRGDASPQGTSVLWQPGLQKRTRRIDALFRIGEDEFVVLLAGAWLPDARSIAEQLRGDVDAAHLDTRRPVSISVGVAGLQHGDSADDWLASKSGAGRLVRADLLLQLQKTLAARELTQVQQAVARHSAVCGRSASRTPRSVNTDRLIDMLAQLGVRVRFVLRPARGRVA